MIISSTHLHWLLRVNQHPPPYSSQGGNCTLLLTRGQYSLRTRVSFIPASSVIPSQMLRSLIKVSYGGDSVNLFSATPGSQKSKGSLALSHQWKTGPQKQPAGCRLWLWGKEFCCLLGLPLGLAALFGFSSGSSLTYPVTRCWVVCPLVFSLQELQCSWCYVACL